MTAAPYGMRLGIPVVAVDGKARRCRFCTVVGASFGLWVGFGAVHAQSEPYLLGPMDKLHVRVVEWQTSDGVFRDWSPINGDYAVGPSGTLSIPLIGEIEAEGRTTAEIGAQISDRLQEKLGLSDRPEAALEVAEFRPIYVSGDIQNPGAFPFAPGLTVVKTVSLAGGVRRATDQNLRVERDFLQAEGGRDVLSSEYRRLLARKARFEAELAGETEIKEPELLADYADGAALIADEKAILLADEQRLRRQLKSLADLKGLLESEIASLAEKKKAWIGQLERERKELTDISSLANRGLVVNTRVSDMQRSVNDIESRLLDLDVASLRAKQDVSKADQDSSSLRSDRTAKLAADLQQVDGDLESVRLKLETQEALMREAVSLEPLTKSSEEEPQIVYTISRVVDGKTIKYSAREDTTVHPGDVVDMRVERRLSAY